MDSCGWGIEEKEESIISINVQSIKMKYVYNNYIITAYKDVIFICQFGQSATNRYQSISIYLLIVIENRYQSITTQILAIDGSLIIHINWLIDIDRYRLSN